MFCSQNCLASFRNKQKALKCGNPNCEKIFKRQPCEIQKSRICFCSRSCSTIISNLKSPKRQAKNKTCPTCKKLFTGRKKYCSKICQPPPKKIGKRQIIREIKKLYKDKQRLPFKRECQRYHVAQLRFGSWNKAIVAAGFKPNPVLFARKHIANDGHKCDSLTEKIIDDWLYARKIKHETNVSYPGDKLFTVDFVIGRVWIEFFGLSGELRAYDKIKKEKVKIAKKFNLHLIAIYPHDLFPKFKLDKKLNHLK